MSGTPQPTWKSESKTILSSNAQKSTAAYWPTAGWRTSTPEAQGMFSGTLAKTLEMFGSQGVHSVAVIRNGYLVAEAYNASTQEDVPQDLKSVTKSVTSALVGIALHERKLISADQKVAEFFPELANDRLKSRMTIKHLLSMTSGIAWDNTNESSSTEMMYSPDWVQYITGRPGYVEPGSLFNYSNGDAHLVSAVLYKATGQSMLEYAKSRLFGPLGIDQVSWNEDPQGRTIGAWALALTLRDMAKIGYLYLKEGEWDGQTIIPKAWIRDSLQKRVTLNYSNGTQGGYGLYWWSKTLEKGLVRGGKKPYNLYYASGSGGRRIFVIPELQLVVAATANSPDVDMPEYLLLHVLQAIRSDKPLPENQEACAKLEQAVQSFRHE
ncbi:serine hydrolase domain-containing protein [Paenibacillus sp. GCM10023248]|uniref:serine hydrolase domain-containing protein n=1 Tax=Bacillales TaxID=1385 RepID=UPI0023787AFD|nr:MULTISPECIES: serine hydrolase [Bacillales]MDD9266948.1 serine hydrolase [Paenibacillus sp. MAHUQ-63]MDR6881147.1 CubicO group peptidase (beta-lactamase class C family) [Bacillus sp. 3255]